MNALKKIILGIMISIAPANILFGYPLCSSYPICVSIPVPMPVLPMYTYQTPIIYPSYSPYYYEPIFMNLNIADTAQASFRALVFTVIFALSLIAADSISR